ncbi:MAG TPA: rhomboid family intramembrane serine protease [Trebonia sp.]|jgi:membrane associated rhomboid family serine protease|nr:rhomboid family intramembrane serine protease [Trebonia sp.]
MTAADHTSPDPGNTEPVSTGGAETPPTCYRHPDRETWVSCVRCGKHACPDCLRQAAVGQQCVDCVRDAGQGTRQARTAFGGRPAAGAVVTWTLVGLNVALFLVELVYPSLGTDWALFGYARVSFGGPLQGVAAGEWYRLITSAFLPPAPTGAGGAGTLGFLDIAFNLWALIVVGPSLEQLLGRVRFLAVYLLSALGGAVAFFLIAPPTASALGASGAIFGLFGAWFVVARKLRIDIRGIVTIILINLAFSFFYRGTIAWQDHVGGLIVGALTAFVFAYAPRRHRTAIQIAACVAILAVLVVLVIYRSHDLTSQLGV